MYYDRDGNPIEDVLEWARLFATADRIVAQTEVGPYVVSTVWLGLDHNWYRQGPPLIFETMVFGDGARDLDCYRWPTEAAAVEGHQEVVTLVRATVIDVPESPQTAEDPRSTS